jgi:hypothetical protein
VDFLPEGSMFVRGTIIYFSITGKWRRNAPPGQAVSAPGLDRERRPIEKKG